VSAELGLEGTEVADVVPGPELHLELVATFAKLRKQGKQLEEIVGLEEDLGLVGGAPHRDGQLNLPALKAERADRLEDRCEVRHRKAIELRVARHTEPLGARVGDRVERGSVRALDPTEAVVDDLVAVDSRSRFRRGPLPSRCAPQGAAEPRRHRTTGE
jgi:hypothetical protein